MSDAWESAFVAVSVALGEPLDAVTAAIDEVGLARASELVRGLRARTKGARAIALAMALAEVATELERMELR